MTIEGNVGADHSLLSSAADVASANARAAQGGFGSPVSAMGATPSGAHYAAPTALVMAACLVPTGASGLFQVAFNFYFTDSAADTVSIAVHQVAAATAISGGTVQGGWSIDEGTAVVVVGGADALIETLPVAVTTGALSTHISAAFTSFTPAPGSQIAIKLLLTAAHTLSAMVFNGSVLQIG